MNLTELEKLADAVYGPLKDDWELKQALYAFDKAANPQVIKKLITLCRLQHDALETAKEACDGNSTRYDSALVAYEEFNK